MVKEKKGMSSSDETTQFFGFDPDMPWNSTPGSSLDSDEIVQYPPKRKLPLPIINTKIQENKNSKEEEEDLG